MAQLKEADAARLHQEDIDMKRGVAAAADQAVEQAVKTEAAADNDAKPSTTTTERHISIQTKLKGLEMLVDLSGGECKSCPLCPEEKFKTCDRDKMRRHLLNLHWRVCVKFEGQRMCICHLPCRNLKSCLSGDRVSGRHIAHYHCVVCSVTAARKADMVSHLKCHINKEETEASFSVRSDVPFEEPGKQCVRHST